MLAPKLLVLDLNETLVLRSRKNTHAWARPYTNAFLQYIFHESASRKFNDATKSPLDVMIWSSAQPHSVDMMVKTAFGDHARSFIAVWDRTHLGLSRKQYHRKTPTIKDLRKPWKTLPAPYNSHSGKTTILLDDSVDKAQLQPHNHICISRYNREVRAKEVAPLSPDQSDSTRAPLDETLIAIIGILDEIRKVDDVSTWIGDGRLKTVDRKVSRFGEGASLPTSSSLASLNAVFDDGIWFEDQRILTYWIDKGRKVLEELDIPILPGSNERMTDQTSVQVTVTEVSR